MENNLKISVVTVCFNAVKDIERTMLSVLNQTYPNIEYIVIDGGSTDGTMDIIRKYADRLAYWVSEPDRGIYDAMNKGILAATGDYINFMNAGDSFHNEIVIKDVISQIKSDTIIAYGDWCVKYGDYSYTRRPLDWKYVKRQIPFCHQAAFYSTSYHKQHLFPNHLHLVGDYKIIYDAYHSNIQFQYIPLIVADYDITIGNSASEDLYRACLDEKYIVWDIQANFWKKLPYEIDNYLTVLSYQIKKSISPSMVIKIKQLKEKFRKHNK